MRRPRLIPVPELAARYARVQRDLALSRTTFKPTVLAQWLLSFVQTDLRRLSPLGWRDLQDELVVFSLPPVQFSPIDGASVGDLEHPPRRREIEAAQRELKPGITRLLKRPGPGGWSIPNLQVCRSVVRTRGGKIVGGYRSRTFRERFLMAAADLIESVGERIKQCLECERLFPAVKRQTYCSPRCSQRVRTRRFRVRHRGTLGEKRRERYEARLRAIHGKRVKIQRRKALG